MSTFTTVDAISCPILHDPRRLFGSMLLTIAALVVGSACSATPPSAQPPANSGDVFLKVVGAEGSPATYDGVIAAQVGFPQTSVKHWSGLRDRDGLVSLAGLPNGTHTLVLAPKFSTRTVFTLDLPSNKRVIDAPLRSMVAWRSTNLFLKATVHEDPRQGAIVRVRIENGTDETLNITERDICLETGSTGREDWGLSPQWRKEAAGPFPVTTIEPKQKGEIELTWRDWIRDGLWFRYDDFPRIITGPALPEPKPGEISVRVWVRSHGVLPVGLPHPSRTFLPASSTEQDGAAARTADDAPPAVEVTPEDTLQRGETIDNVTEQLFRRYVVSGGKIPTASVNAAIVLVAAEGGRNAAFRETVLEEFEKSCAAENASGVRRNLLRVMGMMLGTEGSWRWQYEREQRTGEVNQSAVPRPDDPKFLYAESKMLARIIARGRQSDRSDIDAFVIAIREAHHPQGTPFLLDVLRNPDSTEPFVAPAVPRNPAATVPPTAPEKNQIGKGKWPDNLGGSWRDARFHAAVALAELGEPEGVEWLIQQATPNDFGIDGSVYRVPHRRVASGSLRENCLYVLADISGLPPEPGIDQWTNWWAANKDAYAPLPVSLRLD